jgi:predicted kinase
VPKIHMIHGFLGAGKTTFAKKLEKETGATRFSPDEWMVEHYGTNPPVGKFQEYYEKLDKLIWKEIERLVADGRDVIMDFGFWDRAERDKTRAFAKDAEAEAILYNLQCTENVMRERVAKRTADTSRALVIDENAFELFKTRFEPLDPIAEPSIIITTNPI